MVADLRAHCDHCKVAEGLEIAEEVVVDHTVVVVAAGMLGERNWDGSFAQTMEQVVGGHVA